MRFQAHNVDGELEVWAHGWAKCPRPGCEHLPTVPWTAHGIVGDGDFLGVAECRDTDEGGCGHAFLVAVTIEARTQSISSDS